MSESRDLTDLLLDWKRGDLLALEQLAPLVFNDLRRLARVFLRREGSDHTFQPTALVNELFLLLMNQKNASWQNREQFFAVAALLMRRILVDYAKGRKAAKRGGRIIKVPLEDASWLPGDDRATDLLALDEALSRLSALDPRQGKIVELRYFFGLSHEEIAQALEISSTTVKREWQTARLWLFRELGQKIDNQRESQ